MKSGTKRILLVAAIALSFAFSRFQDQINPYFLAIIIYVGINTVLASSLNLISGFTGQFSLGHAGFMSLGAYTASMITLSLHASPGDASSFVTFPLGLLAGGVVASIAGLLVGIPTLRLKGDYLAITTLGLGEIIRVIIQNLEFVGGARGLVGIPKFSSLFWVFSVVAVVIFMISNLINSTYGKGFLAVRDDEVAAQAMGINTTKFKVIAFITGAFFAGVAGGLYAHFISYITPSQFGFIKSIEIVVMVIVGGMGNTVGVILAAVLLTILPEALRGVAEYRMVLYSLMLVIIMISRPQGLFGTGFKKFLRKSRKQPATT
ncbi:MAG TPA: branched-chain amino acid ABC transporter permease [Bacteroidota bacterium]|jgi:branched-chain amino acid transport system permease protein|nr:branched-chain amino acid ABC transporter permease [Bacteroidota bacterium]